MAIITYEKSNVYEERSRVDGRVICSYVFTYEGRLNDSNNTEFITAVSIDATNCPQHSVAMVYQVGGSPEVVIEAPAGGVSGRVSVNWNLDNPNSQLSFRT